VPLPLTPDALDLLRLSLVTGVSPRAQRLLLERYGTAREVFAQSEDLVEFAGPDAAGALSSGADSRQVAEAIEWAQQPRNHLLTIDDDRYPPLLREVNDAPAVLYAQGRVELLATPCFAIVGSRNATAQGREDARAFARTLSDAGLCIVSGLALGVDAAAHGGGLEGRSSSIAVTGTGIDVVYPDANGGLAARLAESGCVVTEFFLGTSPNARNFPRRNRLISGLARGVLVIEANYRSGSLSTARHANEQGREVFALPGSIHSTLSKGCHRLIKDGAKLVEDASDILVELRLQPVAQPARARRATAHPLLVAMGFDPVSLDLLAQRTGMEASSLAAELSLLEIDGTICALPGGRFLRLDGPA
jgi:DNA processing protein